MFALKMPNIIPIIPKKPPPNTQPKDINNHHKRPRIIH